MTRIALLTLAIVLLAPPVTAEPGATFSADAAFKAVNGCATHARAKGQSHAIAAVDSGGHLLAFLRMDGNAPGIGEFAIQKAEAVASWHFSTALMERAARETPGFANAPHVVTVPGGLPVFAVDGSFLGAVGVSGEGAEDDSACAEAAIKASGYSAVPAPVH